MTSGFFPLDPSDKFPDPAILNDKAHYSSDTDQGPGSIHHTLGQLSSNASPGNHKHDGTTSPLLDYGIPGASAVGDVAAEGTADTFSRSDHIHTREGFGAPSASNPGDASVTGTALTVSRSDHVHAREDELKFGVVKTDTEFINNSSTLQADDVLLTPSLPANSIWEWYCLLKVDGPAAADIKGEWRGPANASVSSIMLSTADATTVVGQDATLPLVWSRSTTAVGTVNIIQFSGTLMLDVTAGSFALWWAQNTPAVGNTRIHPRSALRLLRLV